MVINVANVLLADAAALNDSRTTISFVYNSRYMFSECCCSFSCVIVHSSVLVVTTGRAITQFVVCHHKVHFKDEGNATIRATELIQ